MYLPKHFAVEDKRLVLDMLRTSPFGHLVTGGGAAGGGLLSTPLPFLVNDELSTIRAHFSRANPHWKSADGADALLIVPLADAYISPSWYPSKAEHGKVVPTWNYEVVQLTGILEIHDTDDWKLSLVSELTDHNEQQVLGSETDPGSTRGSPWKVSDAPDDFIANQLKAIVGVEMTVTSVEGKQKLSQNKPEQDQRGAIVGLNNSSHAGKLETAARMSQAADR